VTYVSESFIILSMKTFNPRAFGKRLEQARSTIKASQEDVGALFGITRNAVSNWEHGKNPPKADRLAALCDFLKVSADWLLFGVEVSERFSEENYRDLMLNEEFFLIPKYQDIKLAAGSGHVNHNVIEESKSLAFRRDWIRSKGFGESDLRVVEVTGNSMAPYITHGESVLIDTTDLEIRSGEIYAFQTPDGLRIKRFIWQADGQLRISSDNPDKGKYPDEVYSRENAHTIQIIGRKVWRGG